MLTRSFPIAEGIHIGGEFPPVLFAGPCVIENERMVMEIAGKVSLIARTVGIPYIFKASYDKANRTSGTSFRGPGIHEGLRILEKVKKELNIPVITDAHSPEEFKMAGEVVDVVQIPAFLCRQTDLIIAAVKTGKVVNVKKGQFLSPDDVPNIIEKITTAGGERIIITERGTSFGYNRLIVDYTGIVKIREFGLPLVFDATHSVQSPGGLGGKSGGESKYAPWLAWAAAAIGIDGLFIETHENPDKALSDGPNMIPLDQLEQVLVRFMKIIRAI